MGLDIRLPMKPGEQLPPKYFVSLDDDGYYWFMHPQFETLKEKTGQYLDLYGGATFAGESLSVLKETVTAIREQVINMPERWEVHTGDLIGSHLHPTPPQPIFKTVEKETFLDLLDRLDEVVDAAVRTGTPIVALGD